MITIATAKKPASGPKNRPKKKGAGRPGLYKEWLTEEKLILLQGWTRDGVTDKDIAQKKIGISPQTFCEWKTKYPEFAEALKKGREVCDYEVENALHRRAIGYYITVKKPVKLKEEKQKVGEGKVVTERIEMVEEEVYIPPDPSAMYFWLQNRKPEQWKDRRTVNVQAAATVDIDQQSVAEIENQVKQIVEQNRNSSVSS